VCVHGVKDNHAGHGKENTEERGERRKMREEIKKKRNKNCKMRADSKQ
jgi:hypothetical protein